MKKLKVALVGIKFDDDSIDSFPLLRKLDFLNDVEIHLVHISNMHHYSLGEDLNIPIYPEGEAKVVIEHAVSSKLESLSREILPLEFTGKVVSQSLFSKHPKKAFLEYAEKIHANLIILFAEKKRHFSMGSFIQYQIHHSPVNVFVLRELDHKNTE
jgi:nucleotide-binding universal stress UspA family protein